MIININKYRGLQEHQDPLVLGGKMERGGRLVLLEITEPRDLLETKDIQDWLEHRDHRDRKDHR